MHAGDELAGGHVRPAIPAGSGNRVGPCCESLRHTVRPEHVVSRSDGGNQSRKRISVLVSRATDEGSRSFAVAARSGAGASISSADLYGRLAHSISKPQKPSQPPWPADRKTAGKGKS